MSGLYKPGSGLEVPGVEAILEYGDDGDFYLNEIPDALKINDRSQVDQVHVSDISGLNDDPDSADARTERADRWGEDAGRLVPRGRTVGLTGRVQAGNTGRMRDLWRRTRAQFGRKNKDLLVHPAFETPLYVNEVHSDVETGWDGTATVNFVFTPAAFTDGFMNGVAGGWFATIGSPPAGPLYMRPPVSIEWNGEDVWLSAIVQVSSAASTITSIALGLDFYAFDLATLSLVQKGTWTATGTGAQASPVTGTYYRLSARMVASTMAVLGANFVIPRVSLATTPVNGTYGARVARMAAVKLSSAAASPAGYVGAKIPGHEWEGLPRKSRSYGPCYAVNQVADPDASVENTWANDSTAGVTVDVAGSISRDWPGAGSASNAWTITNPSTTSRTLAVRTPNSLTDPNLFVVDGGHSYRAHLRLRVDEAFTSGLVTIVWLDKAGATISSSTVGTFAAVAPGGPSVVVSVDGVVVAPALALRAYLRVASSVASIVTNNKLSIRIAEPRFVDVSSYDVGADTRIDSSQSIEHGLSTYSMSRLGPYLVSGPAGARRRIPRPFLLRKVRSIWDGKAPESQRGLQARRDFTMSLRSADPRVYVREDRHASLRASATLGLVSSRGATIKPFTPVATGDASLPTYLALIGLTQEGTSYATNMAFRATSLGAPYPRDGITIGYDERFPPAAGTLYSAASLARFYYSSGSITYTTPQVTVSGNVHNGAGFDYELFFDSLVNNVWQYNYLSVLVKRVSSTTWLELRYNLANFLDMVSAHPAAPTPPFTLELWCSHNTSGTLATTRLAAWDAATVDVLSGALKHVRAYMTGTGVVYCELWDKDPNFADDGLFARQSYTLPGPLSTLMGPSVAGRAGFAMRLGQWADSGTGYDVYTVQSNYDTPYFATFEAVDYSNSVIFLPCPVIGDADDVPLKIQLRGDVNTPTITLINQDTGESASLMLSGLFPESDPVTIDMDAGTITSASGANYFDRRLVGSRFFSLSPGNNVIAFQATGWDTAALAHVIATWKDALK